MAGGECGGLGIGRFGTGGEETTVVPRSLGKPGGPDGGRSSAWAMGGGPFLPPRSRSPNRAAGCISVSC